MCNGKLHEAIEAEYHIFLSKCSNSFRLQPYQIRLRARQVQQKSVDEPEKSDFTVRSQSECVSLVVLVSKLDGTLRFCVDSWQLNERAARKMYPVPRMDERFGFLGDAGVLTILYCSSGYCPVSVVGENILKTAFNCSVGTYSFQKIALKLIVFPRTF